MKKKSYFKTVLISVCIINMCLQNISYAITPNDSSQKALQLASLFSTEHDQIKIQHELRSIFQKLHQQKIDHQTIQKLFQRMIRVKLPTPPISIVTTTAKILRRMASQMFHEREKDIHFKTKIPRTKGLSEEQRQKKQAQAEEYYNMASVLDDIGTPEALKKALEYFDKALALHPTFSYAWTNKGVTLRKLGRYKEAFDAYTRAIECDRKNPLPHLNKETLITILMARSSITLDENNPIYWRKRAKLFFEYGGFLDALICIQKAIKLNPRIYKAHILKAVILEALKHPKEELEAYDAAIAIEPKILAAYLAKGLVYCKQERFEEALQEFNKALKCDKKNYDALFHKACALLNLNRPQEALLFFDRALAIEPNSIDALIQKGSCLCALKDYANALKICDKIISLGTITEKHKALHNKIVIYLEIGKNEDALKTADLAIAAGNTSEWPHIQKAIVFERMGKYEEALKCLDEAIRRNHKNTTAWFNRGNNLVALKLYRDALDSYNKALAITPQDSQIWGNKARTLYILGKYEKALEAAIKTTQYSEQNCVGWLVQGDALDALKRYKQAIKAYNKGLSFPESDPGVHLALLANKIITLHNMKKLPEALAICNKVLCKFPLKKNLLITKAMILWDIGEHEESFKLFEQLIERYPEDENLILNKGLMHFKNREFRKALEYFNRLQLENYQSKTFSLLWYMGRAHAELEETELAFECCDKALAFNNQDFNVWIFKGSLLAYIGRNRDALELFSNALDQYTDPLFRAYLWFSKIQMLAALHDLQKAIQTCDEALEEHPDDLRILLIKGTILFDMHKNAEAKMVFAEALKKHPSQKKEIDEIKEACLKDAESGSSKSFYALVDKYYPIPQSDISSDIWITKLMKDSDSERAIAKHIANKTRQPLRMSSLAKGASREALKISTGDKTLVLKVPIVFGEDETADERDALQQLQGLDVVPRLYEQDSYHESDFNQYLTIDFIHGFLLSCFDDYQKSPDEYENGTPDEEFLKFIEEKGEEETEKILFMSYAYSIGKIYGWSFHRNVDQYTGLFINDAHWANFKYDPETHRVICIDLGNVERKKLKYMISAFIQLAHMQELDEKFREGIIEEDFINDVYEQFLNGIYDGIVSNTTTPLATKDRNLKALKEKLESYQESYDDDITDILPEWFRTHGFEAKCSEQAVSLVSDTEFYESEFIEQIPLIDADTPPYYTHRMFLTEHDIQSNLVTNKIKLTKLIEKLRQGESISWILVYEHIENAYHVTIIKYAKKDTQVAYPDTCYSQTKQQVDINITGYWLFHDKTAKYIKKEKLIAYICKGIHEGKIEAILYDTQEKANPLDLKLQSPIIKLEYLLFDIISFLCPSMNHHEKLNIITKLASIVKQSDMSSKKINFESILALCQSV